MSEQTDTLDLEGLSLGACLSATKVEGGDRGNDWFYWHTLGKIEDGTTPYVATEFFNRYETDAELARSLSIKKMRLGVEWSRIEPQRSKFDMTAVAHYKKIFRAFKDRGIDVLLDLHHFSNPVWFDKLGGFESADAAEIFLKYVSVAAKEFLPLVEGFVTFNEPNRYVHNAFVTGLWPMGLVKKDKRANKAMSNIAFIHTKAYALIHAIADELEILTKVGAFISIRIFKNKYTADFLGALNNLRKAAKYQESVDEAMFLGEFRPPFKRPKILRLSERFAALKEYGVYGDFIGIGYYTRVVTNGNREEVKEGADVDDTGAEVYPEGLVKAVRRLEKYALPVYVTSGVADKGDTFRSRYIASQLEALLRSRPRPQRFYYDSLTDGFAWAHGVNAKFGLIEVDYGSQERKVRGSGQFYKKIIEEKKIVIDETLASIRYKKNEETAD